jgi:hypothetical protein
MPAKAGIQQTPASRCYRGGLRLLGPRFPSASEATPFFERLLGCARNTSARIRAQAEASARCRFSPSSPFSLRRDVRAVRGISRRACRHKRHKARVRPDRHVVLTRQCRLEAQKENLGQHDQPPSMKQMAICPTPNGMVQGEAAYHAQRFAFRRLCIAIPRLDQVPAHSCRAHKASRPWR